MSETKKDKNRKKGASANPQASDWMMRFSRWRDAERTDEVTFADVTEILDGWAWTGELERGLESTEKNPDGYEHWQIFGQAPSKKRFSTIRKRFTDHGVNGPELQVRWGTVQEAIDYARKEGKWKDSEKEDTRISDPITQGVFDLRDQQGKKKDDDSVKKDDVSSIVLLSNALDAGKTPDDILRDPKLRLKASRSLGWVRATYDAMNDHFDPKYRVEDREVDITYVYGASGAGKTRYALGGDRKDIYLAGFVTDDKTGKADMTIWHHVFDLYRGEDTLVLDDFYSSVPYNYFLRLVDRYPFQLDARNRNRWAGWTKVIITSNASLDEQYAWLKDRAALMRRIHHIYRMDGDGGMTEE